MDRILQGVSATLSVTFETSGVATDPSPDTATVVITRADGTTLASGNAYDDGTGTFSYDLTPAETADLDILTATWTATFGGQSETVRTTTEIVSAFYFSIAEFRAHFSGDADVAALSAQQIADARMIAEDIIERACHVAFVVRVSTFTVSGQWTTRLDLPVYMLRSVTAVTIDGTAQDITGYRVWNGGIYRSTSFPRNPGNVSVTVTHGYDAPSAWLRDAALTLAYHRAIKGPISDRATSAPAGDAGGVITLLTPGVNNAVTGIPDVDEAILQHRLPDPKSVSSVVMADASNTYPDPLEDFAIG